MAIEAILFDLDDTLIVDEAVSRESLESTADLAVKLAGVERAAFLRDVARNGLELWRAGRCHDYTKSIGISHYECLWGKFEGASAELTSLREWARDFRVAVFNAALRGQGIGADDTGEELAAHFEHTRRRLQRLMPDAVEVLSRLKAGHLIALLTNGAPDLQREKIAASGLGGFFDAIAVSGEHGIGKPKAGIFHLLLDQLGVQPGQAVMVGNSLERDIAGARNAGLAASIWLRVPGSEEHDDVVPDHEIIGLHEVPGIVERL